MYKFNLRKAKIYVQIRQKEHFLKSEKIFT
jgi:hypothetical protein